MRPPGIVGGNFDLSIERCKLDITNDCLRNK